LEGVFMKVSIKDLQVAMDLGNNGITLDVYDNQDTHRGDLRIGKATIEWCRGRIRTGNGVKVSWDDLIAWFEGQGKPSASTKAKVAVKTPSNDGKARSAGRTAKPKQELAFLSPPAQR
jgi:hypothetical protein